MVKALVFLLVILACDIGAMKKDHLSPTGTESKRSLLRSSASDLNQSKGVSSRRILGRAASADTEDPSSKKVVSNVHQKFTRSDDTTSSSTSSLTFCSSVSSSSQTVSNQVTSRSSSKSPRELKASRVESLKNIKKNFFDSDDDDYPKIGHELCVAIKKNNFSRVLDILYFNVNDTFGEEGKTPLLVAIEEGRHEIILELLGYAGIDVNKSDKFGKTPLIVAIEKGYNDIALKLLGWVDIDVNRADAFGKTPLISAIQKLIHFKPSSKKVLQELVESDKITSKTNDDVIKFITKFLEREDVDLNKADNRKNTPLHHAVLKHNKEIINLLLLDHRINSLFTNIDKYLASQLIDEKCYEDVSLIIRIFFDRATLDALVNDEAFDLHLNKKTINDEKINAVVDVIKQGVKKDHGQDGDRKLPEKEPLFLKDEFIKKTLMYRLEKSKQPDKIGIIINNTTQEI